MESVMNCEGSRDDEGGWASSTAPVAQNAKKTKRIFTPVKYSRSGIRRVHVLRADMAVDSASASLVCTLPTSASSSPLSSN